MRIGLDYLPAVCHAPGIGRYARELVRALVRLPDCPELALFEIGGGARVMEGPALGLEGARVVRRRARLPRRVFELYCRAARSGADRVLGGVELFQRMLPDYPPVRAARQVLPIAELPPAGSAADARLGRGVGRVEDVIVFSTHYAREVCARYSLPPERVHRVPVGCDHWRREIPELPAPPGAPHLVVLGAVRRARRPLEVLRGFAELHAREPGARLSFVGRPGDAAPALEAALARSPARASVRWIRAPLEADMPALVAGATALVHLAADEGSAVTPLEAFSLGLAVLATRLPAFEEALGADAVWVAPGEEADAGRLAAGMAAALASAPAPAARQARVARSAGFTWERSARETLDLWRRLVRSSGL